MADARVPLMHDSPITHCDAAQVEALLRRRVALSGIVRLLIRGYSRKEIARALCRSQHTIDWHLRELYRTIPGLTAVKLASLVSTHPQLQAVLLSLNEEREC